MANPQIENGHVKIAREIFDCLCKFRIPGEVRQVIDAVIRKTYGWNKKEDMISLSQFVEITELGKTNICRALATANKHKLIISHDNTYKFNKNYDDWIPFNYTQGGKHVISHDNTVISHDNKPLSATSTTKDNKDTITKDKYGEFLNVHLSKEEYKKLAERLGQAFTKELIEELSGYKKSKGKEYKDDYATILNWARRRWKENKEKASSDPSKVAWNK